MLNVNVMLCQLMFSVVKCPGFNALKMQRCTKMVSRVCFHLYLVLFHFPYLGNGRLRLPTMNDFVIEVVMF